MRQLRAIGIDGIPAIFRAVMVSDDPEVSSRCWFLIREFTTAASSDVVDRMHDQLGQIAGENDRFAKRVARLFRAADPEPTENANAMWVPPVAPRPAPRPLTPAEKAKLAKRKAYDKVIDGIDRQIRRMKQTADLAPQTNRAKYTKAIESLGKRRKVIQDLKERVK